MPAAVYLGDGEIAVRDVDVPECEPTDALVEVSHCGICGTDLHLVLEKYARPDSVLGHEWAGTIAAVGADVHGWEIGARVVQNPTPGCGTCRACLRGRPAVCLRREPPDLLDFTRGAFCQYKTVPASRLLRVPDSLSTRAAALTEPTAIAIHTVNLSGAAPDSPTTTPCTVVIKLASSDIGRELFEMYAETISAANSTGLLNPSLSMSSKSCCSMFMRGRMQSMLTTAERNNPLVRETECRTLETPRCRSRH